jgi:hypothetical protein
MIHRRLILEGKEGKRAQEGLFDLLWEDTSKRLRTLAVPELSVRKFRSKQLVSYYNGFFMYKIDQ